jgi:hypothetical protein
MVRKKNVLHLTVVEDKGQIRLDGESGMRCGLSPYLQHYTWDIGKFHDHLVHG